MLIQHCLELGIMIFRHNMSQFMYHHILYAWLRVLMGALLIAIIPRAMPWARGFCPFRAYGASRKGAAEIYTTPEAASILLLSIQ